MVIFRVNKCKGQRSTFNLRMVRNMLASYLNSKSKRWKWFNFLENWLKKLTSCLDEPSFRIECGGGRCCCCWGCSWGGGGEECLLGDGERDRTKFISGSLFRFLRADADSPRMQDVRERSLNLIFVIVWILDNGGQSLCSEICKKKKKEKLEKHLNERSNSLRRRKRKEK